VSRSDRLLLAASGCAAILALAAATMLFMPLEDEPEATDDQAALVFESFAPTPTTVGASATGPIVVDVEGGVVAPGIRELPAGSRVADAIAAAERR
jgi:hypothetical protein